VLIAATAVELVSLVLLVFAHSTLLLAIVWALQGVYRAMESGPLEAWYVDAALRADPDAAIERGLSAGSAAIGVAVAAGALLAGGLVTLDPWPAIEPLLLPLMVAAMLCALEVGALAALMTETRPRIRWAAVRASVVAVPFRRIGCRHAGERLPGAAGAGRRRAVLGLRHEHVRDAAASTAG
jgi:MFS family permease